MAREIEPWEEEEEEEETPQGSVGEANGPLNCRRGRRKKQASPRQGREREKEAQSPMGKKKKKEGGIESLTVSQLGYSHSHTWGGVGWEAVNRYAALTVTKARVSLEKESLEAQV